MGQNHNLASLTRDRNPTVRNIELRDWHLWSPDASISSPHPGSDKCNHAKFLLNQCSRITDKTQPMSWRDTVGNVCVLCNSLSLFCPSSAMRRTPSRHHPQLSNLSKKDEGLEGESLCGTSAWLNAHISECNGLLLLHFARDLWVWLEMSGRVLKRSNIEGEKLLLVPVLGQYMCHYFRNHSYVLIWCSRNIIIKYYYVDNRCAALFSFIHSFILHETFFRIL